MPSRRTDLPLYLGLYEDIKDRIVSGELAAGEKLPSIRAITRDLRVSINTVNNAYYGARRTWTPGRPPSPSAMR